VSIYASSVAGIAFKKATGQTGHRSKRNSYSFERISRDFTLAHCAEPCTMRKDRLAVRRILGVAALAKKYGVASTDDACAIALETGACTYRFVRRCLERNPQLPLSLRQVDPSIRQLTHYRELIEKRTRQKDDLCTL
jgi:hypothetical protein